MCTLQVYAGANNAHTDSTKDQRGCWKRGMIIAVYEDGVCVEPPSPTGKTVFVHIPGLAKAQAEKYLKQTETRRRVFKIDWSTLPAGVKTTLQTYREVTRTIAQVKTYLRNLETNALEG